MAGFSITGQMKVATLQKSFLKEFGLTLRIYQGRSFADPTQTLAQVRKTKGTGKALAVAKNMKVGNLEDKFEAEFGLKVQVAGSDDSYLCDNDLTLNAAQQEDDKKLARKERKAARQTDEDNDKEDLAPTREVKLRVEGFGGEFQYHRLNKEDADYAREDYNPEDEEDFLDANFTGGDSFDEAIWSGSYGPALSGVELINDDDETKINLDDITKDEIFYTDGEENLRTNCLDYFYITEGKVFGSYTVVLPADEIFDPKKLTIKYIEYFLDGYHEKYGTIIHEVQYGGEVCEAEIEDNGVDIYRSVVGYDLCEGDLTDHIVIYDSNQQDSWEWDRCDEVFEATDSDLADSDSKETPADQPAQHSSSKSEHYLIDHSKPSDAVSITWESFNNTIDELEPYIYAIHCDDVEDLHELVHPDWPESEGRNDFSLIKLDNFEALVDEDDEDLYRLCFSAVVSIDLDQHPRFKTALETTKYKVVARVGFMLDGQPLVDDDGDEEWLYDPREIPFVTLQRVS